MSSEKVNSRAGIQNRIHCKIGEVTLYLVIALIFSAMNTNIKGTNISLSPAISDYVDKRLKKIDDILGEDGSIQCDVELAKTTEHHHKGDIFKAEIHIVGAGKNLYAAAEKSDLYAAIDTVRDDILRECKAGKGKRISLIRRSGARVKNMVKGLWPWGKRN
jgi:ribosomal subunit interface protein